MTTSALSIPTAVAVVRWELPFLLRLPARGFRCWEPLYGLALILPEPQVGAVHWTRTCDFLKPADIYPEPVPSQHPLCYPQEDYALTATLPDGRELSILRVNGGPDGGFSEAKPYTTVNVFLCIAKRNDFLDNEVGRRAEQAVNNLVRLHRFLTMGSHDRPVFLSHDSVCTLTSVADVPPHLQGSPPEVLQRIHLLHFGSHLGTERKQSIGINSWDGLHPGPPLQGPDLEFLYQEVMQEVANDLAIELFLSAIRRLDRRDFALAVVDAQSAFEIVVADALRAGLHAGGADEETIDSEMTFPGKFDQLNKRLKKLDTIAAATNPPGLRFADSAAETNWKKDLYQLRNRVVHGGLRVVTFTNVKAAITAGLVAADYIQQMHPNFERLMRWRGVATTLDHIVEHAGRMTRVL